MKTMLQFQTFGLKQQEFILEMVNHKDWGKLIRYLVGSTMLFSFIGGAFGMKWSDTFPFFKFGPPPIVQFIGDIWDSAWANPDEYGNVPSGEQRLRTVGTSLFTNVVPMGAQIKRSVEGFQAVDQGHSDSPAGKWQYQIKKTPENYLKGTLFGKSYTEEGKNFYNKKSSPTKKTTRNKYNAI